MKRLSHQRPFCSAFSSMAFWLFSFLLLGGCSECVAKLPKNGTIPAVFAFGDSILDQGNNNALESLFRCNFVPYGKDFDDGIPTGRFSNGKTPPDFLAEALGIADRIPAYLDPCLKPQDLKAGVSFASGGSGYDPLTPTLLNVIPLSHQLEHFKEYILKLRGVVGEEATNNTVRNGIHLVASATNDFVENYFINGTRRMQYNVSSYADLLVASASSFVKELYKIGARRIAVFSAPPLGSLPSERTIAGGPQRLVVKKYNQISMLYNIKLTSAIDSLKHILPQSKVVYIDIYKLIFNLVQNPQKYGFEISDRGCCGTGTIEVNVLCNFLSGTRVDDTKYVFWDSFHPTEKAYKFIVDEFLQRYFGKLV